MTGDIDRESIIRVKGGFSDLTGIAPYRVAMQITEFDERTRVKLSNVLFDILEFNFDNSVCSYRYRLHELYDNGANDFCKRILSELFAVRTNLGQGETYNWRGIYESYIQKVLSEAPYNEVLDILWFICDWIYKNIIPQSADHYKIINNFFERENVGYRFIDGRPVNIIDEVEVNEIEEACNCKFDGCKAHIKNAVRLIAEHEEKDYKNSIKESISAVESVCQIITKDEKATLGKTLKKLSDNGLHIHPSLEKAFSNLYGYTSDEGGVRHCEGMFESNVSFEEAKFMLVSCSAFLNFIMSESEKLGL